MISSAKIGANGFEGFSGQLFGQVHGQLAGDDDAPFAGFAVEGFHGQVEVFGDEILDEFDGYFFIDLGYEVFDDFFGQVDVDLAAVERRLGDEGDQHAFQLADVILDVVADEFGNVLGDLDAFAVHFGVQDGHPGFEVGWCEIGGEAPFEAGDEAFFHAFEVFGRSVGGQDDLFAVLVQLVEDVEKDLLGFLFVGQKLDIVDDEDVDHLVEVYKIIDGVVLDGMDNLVRELFGGNEEDGLVGKLLDHFVADGLCEVCFPQADVSKDDQGVKGGGAGALRDGDTGRAGQPVAVSFDERSESILGIELGIDLDLFDPGDDERVFDVLGGNASRAIGGTTLGAIVFLGDGAVGRAVGAVSLTAHQDLVFQPAPFAQLLSDARFEQGYVMFLQPFVEELVWYLYRQRIIVQPDGFDGFEPCPETLIVYTSSYGLETTIPHRQMIFNHSHH